MYLRFSNPSLTRPFRVPLYPVVPILGAIMCLFLLKSILNKPQTGPFFLAYVGVGFVLYFVYGLWNSKLSKGVVVNGPETHVMDYPHGD
jgi:APA family basic amino acid/polyamine antiporter